MPDIKEEIREGLSLATDVCGLVTELTEIELLNLILARLTRFMKEVTEQLMSLADAVAAVQADEEEIAGLIPPLQAGIGQILALLQNNNVPAAITALQSIDTGLKAAAASLSADAVAIADAQAPAISTISPTSGPVSGGTSVAVSGSGFSKATAVFFGATPAASFAVGSDSSLTAVSPASSAGTVDITVVTPSGTSAVNASDKYTSS